MAIKTYRAAMVVLCTFMLAGFALGLIFFSPERGVAETSGQAQGGLVSIDESSETSTVAAPRAQGANQPGPQPPGQLRLIRQSFRRGGLGSKALVTFMLRNGNDYAIKDPEILCTFRSRDGRYSTTRRRTINDTMAPHSLKAIPFT